MSRQYTENAMYACLEPWGCAAATENLTTENTEVTKEYVCHMGLRDLRGQNLRELRGIAVVATCEVVE
jgi:hypothetical protein